MNHKRIYDALIERARIRTLNGYSENHHIIMRSLGGSDNPDNRVDLTAREHFICHLLYAKFQPCRQTIHAAWRMANDGKHCAYGNRIYERSRIQFAKIHREFQKGKKHSAETIEKLRVKNIGNKYGVGHIPSKETRKKISMANTGKKRTEEAIRKIKIARGLQVVLPHTKESKKKISMTAMGNQRWLGRKHSNDTKEKMSIAHKKYWQQKKLMEALLSV